MRRILIACAGALLLFATGCPDKGPQKATPNPGGESIVHQGSKAKLKTDMMQMQKSCQMYQAQKGTWPESLDDVVAEGILRQEQTLDPWGNQYMIEPSGNTVIVTSYGADGEEGGEEADMDWSTADF